MATPEQDKRRLGNTVYDAPMASTETLDVGVGESAKRPQQPPPRIPPPRMDLTHPKPSAPALHLLHDDQTQVQPHQRVRQVQQWTQHRI